MTEYEQMTFDDKVSYHAWNSAQQSIPRGRKYEQERKASK